MKISQYTSMRFLAHTMLLTGLAAALLAPVAGAQEVRMHANVPFKFVVGEHVLPAGTYWVKINRATAAVEFLSQDGAVTASQLAVPAYRDDADAQNGRLSFNDYGDIHILKNVWMPGAAKGNSVPVAKSMLQLAKGAHPGTTTVAAE